MTDIELLKLAAKAAGYDVIGVMEDYDDYYWNGPTWGLAIRGVNGAWNPLEDDGDALRLSVKLKLCPRYKSNASVSMSWYDRDGFFAGCVLESFGKDISMAIRRAIVRAAAEISKAMP